MRRLARWGLIFVGLLSASLLAAPVYAGGCDPSKDPSPRSKTRSNIVFYNETHYAMRVHWADFEGFLNVKSGWVQPGENVSFRTYQGHAWYVEVNTEDGSRCSGPISANSAETCQMSILYDDGFGYKGGFCDFEP